MRHIRHSMGITIRDDRKFENELGKLAWQGRFQILYRTNVRSA